MRVFLITQYFPPEIGAAASRWGDYVDLLVKQNHHVTVLSGMPNYPQGKIFSGYRNQLAIQENPSPKLRIIRSGVWVNDRRSPIKMLGNYISFSISGLINGLKVRKYDLIILSSPPLFVGLIGMVFKKIKMNKLFLDVRDLWPESAVALGQIKSRWLVWFGKKLESKIYHSADGFIFPVPGFREYFKKNFPDQMNKPMVDLVNGVHEDFLLKANDSFKKMDDNFNVLYSGNMGLAQGLEVVIEAAKLLKDYPIRFQFIGNGVSKNTLKKFKETADLDNVYFMDPIGRENLIMEIKKASLCLVPLINKELFRVAIPSKIFEIMACNKPIILGVEGVAASIIEKYNCGTVVPPEDPVELKNGILTYYNNKNLIKNHGDNGVRAVTNHFRKEFLLSQFINTLKSNKYLK